MNSRKIASVGFLIVVTAVVGFGSTASGEIVTLDLPELLGTYISDYPSGVLWVSIDLGTTFETINGVSMQLSGTLTPGLARDDGVEMPWHTGFAVGMNEPDPGSWLVFVGPYDGPFSEQNAFWGGGHPTWDFLLDGQAQLYAELLPNGFYSGVGVETPSAEITEAQLIVDGVVPEPATLSLLAIGGLALIRRKKH